MVSSKSCTSLKCRSSVWRMRSSSLWAAGICFFSSATGSGVRTPEPVAELKKQMPAAHKELERIRQTLERHFKDVQDFELTIEDGVVYMLQTRNGKRTAMAALKFSMDMHKEKLIDWKTAVMRNPADQLEQLLELI